MKADCAICGEEIEVTMCCSGRDCGCMGMPTEPPVCSEKCYNEYMKPIKAKRDETRKSIL